MQEQGAILEQTVFELDTVKPTQLQTVSHSIPSHWRLVLLEEIASEIGSGITPRGGEASYQQSGIPLIRSQNVLMNRLSLHNVAFISPEVHQSMLRSAVAPGDILLNITGASIGRVAVVPDALRIANVNQHVCRIYLQQNAFSKFVCYFLSSLRGQSQILGSQFGTTRQGLNYGNVRTLRIPLPPLPEQRAIAHVLQTAQNALQARRKELELERERKAALMQHFFRHGTRDEPTKQTEIGEMPESWEVVRLGEIANIASGGTPDRTKQEYWNGAIPWVKTGEINYNIILDTEEKISKQGLDYSSAKLIPAGTLLMAMYGQGVTRGRVAILGIEAAVNQACAAMLVKDVISTQFLFYFLTYKYISIRELGHGANQKNLNAILIKSIFLPLPTKNEQLEIAEYLSVCDSKITTLEKEIALQEELFRALLDELMTGRLSTLPLVE